ncbi:MAG: hypothetical protein ACJ0P1_03115, partial [Flavobacteriaceae bacterium]
IMGQLDDYGKTLDENISYIDSVVIDKEKEITLIYWTFRPQGSHGKTSISSMILHVLKYNSINVDYMLGAHGFIKSSKNQCKNK